MKDLFGWLFSGAGKGGSAEVSVAGASLQEQSSKVPGACSCGEADPTGWPVGKVVGDIYVIRDVIDRGGMGLVYRAFDLATHRDIAVKVPLGRWEYDRSGVRRLVRFVDSPEAKKNLLAEVRAWIGLVHPHVVRAFDVRDDQSTDYQPAIFMDFCDGGSLAGRIYEGAALSLAEGLDVAIQVCWAMEYMHQQKLVHRDLKSQNVLLMRDGDHGVGRALVTDLGLAKALGVRGMGSDDVGRGAEEAALWVTVSAAGGTPTHMAPEQWTAGSHVGVATDVYAFGVLLYEIFCRRLPFSGGQDLRQWQRAHQETAVPDPRRWNSQIPAVLAELMMQCLAKEPKARPRDFGELEERLGAVYRGVVGREHNVVRPKPLAAALTAEVKRQQAWAKIRLGLGAFRRGDLEAAFREMKEVEALFRDLGDKEGLAASLGNQALILRDWVRLEEAMALLKQKEAICRELGDKAGLAGSLGNQALILRDWVRLEEAMALLKQQEAICRELGDAEGLAISLANQALILGLELGLRNEALAKGQEALRLCSQAGLAPLAMGVQELLDKIRAAGQ